MYVIALSESTQWGIGIGAPVVLAVISLAFKAKIMTAVDEKMKPVKSEIHDNKVEHDKKYDDIKSDISNLKIDLAVTTTTLNGMIGLLRDTQKENKAFNTELKELIKEKDENSKRNFEIVFDKLDKKADKK